MVRVADSPRGMLAGSVGTGFSGPPAVGVQANSKGALPVGLDTSICTSALSPAVTDPKSSDSLEKSTEARAG